MNKEITFIKKIQRGLINYIKSCNLKWLIVATFIVLFLMIFSSNILEGLINPIYKEAKSENVKNQVLEVMDYCTIFEKIMMNKYILWGMASVIAIAWVLILYFRCFYEESTEKEKKFICIFGHTTFKESQFVLSDEESKKIELDISKQLNLKEDIEHMNSINQDMNYIIKQQDDFIRKFNNNISNDTKYGYMGISHTPLILRAGNKIGDGIDFILFHKKRNKNYYEQLNDSDAYPKLDIEEVINPNSRELIVSIATSFPIEDYQLEVLNPQNKSMLKFKSEELGVDSIFSKKQLEEYINIILVKTRTVVANNRINMIHMVISSSVSLTFALGQRINKTYYPEVVIYNFDMNNQKYYPWGINLFKNYNECLIIN